MGYPRSVDIAAHSRFRAAADAQVKPLDDGGVIVDTRTGKCWELNPVGYAIWQHIVAGKSVGETAEAVAARHSISIDSSAEDVMEFVRSLVRERLLELPDDPRTDSAP